MSEGVSKKSKYEIIAILRDELRIQSKLYFYCNDIKHQSTLKKIEGNFFYIKPSTYYPDLPKESIFYFIIHNLCYSEKQCSSCIFKPFLLPHHTKRLARIEAETSSL